jgi:hypothetical protein
MPARAGVVLIARSRPPGRGALSPTIPIAHSSPRAASPGRPARVARTPRRMRSTSLSGIRTQSRSCVAPRRTAVGFLGDPVAERGRAAATIRLPCRLPGWSSRRRGGTGGEDERAVPGAREARHSGGGSTPVRWDQRASGSPGASADRPTPRRGWPSRPSPLAARRGLLTPTLGPRDATLAHGRTPCAIVLFPLSAVANTSNRTSAPGGAGRNSGGIRNAVVPGGSSMVSARTTLSSTTSSTMT